MPCEMNSQGINPAKMKSDDGVFGGSFSANPICLEPKISVKTATLMTGASTAHATPRIACLYRTFTSRQTRKYSSSRWLQSSAQSTAIQPLRALMTSSGRSCASAGGGGVGADGSTAWVESVD